MITIAEQYSVEAYLKATGVDQFSKSFKNANDSLKGVEDSGNKANVSIGSMLKTIAGVAAAVGVFRVLRSSIDLAFRRIDTMEQFERVMTTMTGSTEKANAVLDKTNDIVTGTSYGLDVAAQAVQNFVTSNMEVDKATESVAAWGDAVSFYGDGSNETFNSVTTALAQMTAKGKVQMDTMNRLTEAGIPAMQIYADATGQSVESVAAEMQKGELAADEFMEVMNNALKEGTDNFGAIDGAAKEAGASWSGSFANMRAAVARGVVAIIESIDEMLTSNGLPDMRTMVANFGKAFENILKSASDAIGPMVEGLFNLIDAIKPLTPALVGLVTAFVAFRTSIAISSIVSRLSTVMFILLNPVFALQYAFAALNAIVMANPIAWLIALIAGLVAVFIYLWKTNETFKESIIGAFNAIKGVVMPIIQSISDFIKSIWGSLVSWWDENNQAIYDKLQVVWSSISEVIMPVVDAVVGYVMDLWGSLVGWWNTNQDSLLNKALAVWNFIKTNVTTAVSAVVSFVMEIWSQLTTFWQTHGDMILQAAINIWTVIQTTIVTVVQFIWETIQMVWPIIQTIVVGVITAIWNIIQVAWPIILTIITTAMDIIWSIMQFVWPAIKAIIITTWEAIKNVIQGAIEVITGIIQFFSALFTGNWSALWDSIKQILSGAVQAVWGLVNLWFVGKILKLGKALFNGLKSIVTSIWNTIKSLFTSGVNVARNVVSTGFNFIRNIISTVMNFVRNLISTAWNFIRNIITTVVNGIRNTISNVFNSIRNTISNVVNAIRNTISNIFNSLKGIVSKAFNGVKSAVSNGISGAYKAVTGKMKDFLNAGKNIVGSIADGIKGAASKVTDAISNVTSKIRDFLPFSPAKEGALRDIMKIQIPQSIAESIDNGRRSAVNAMSNLSKAIYGEMPEVSNMNIAGRVANSNAKINSRVDHEINNSSESNIERLLNKIANRDTQIVMDSGELVASTKDKYNESLGDSTKSRRRWSLA